MFAGYKYCTVEDRKFILFIATAKTGLVAFRGYARLVRVRHLRQIVPLLLASVRRHLADRTPVRRQILKPTPKIFGVTITKCTLAVVGSFYSFLSKCNTLFSYFRQKGGGNVVKQPSSATVWES